MNGKRVCFFILSLLFVGSLLCGCAQAPDEVVKSKEEYGDNPQAEESAVTKCTVENIRKSNINGITQKYGNIELPKNIDFSGVEDINILKFQFVDNCRNEKEKIAAAFGIDSNLQWRELQGGLEGDRGLIYESEKKREYLSILDNGGISFQQKNCYYHLIEGAEEDEDMETGSASVPIEKKIYLRHGDSADVVVNLNGKEVLLSEEITWANKKINEIMSIDGTFQYDVRTVYIRKLGNGFHRLSMLAEMQYQGVPLAFHGGGMEFDPENMVGYVKQMDDYITIDIDADKEIDQFLNNGLFEVVEQEAVGQVIDFQSAVDILERTLSGFHKVKIEEIQIMYTLTPKYEYKSNAIYYGAPGNNVESRPVYSFMIKNGEENESGTSTRVAEGGGLCCVNVDMVTGEVTNNFEGRGYEIQ